MPRPSHSSQFDDPNNTGWGYRSRGKCSWFASKPVFTVRGCQNLAQPPSWRTTPWLSETVYSIYSQLPSIVEAVPPSATWGRAMPWWQGPTFTFTFTYWRSDWSWRMQGMETLQLFRTIPMQRTTVWTPKAVGSYHTTAGCLKL
jgi:hypothetical protein